MKGYYKILLSAPFISAIAACSSGPAKDFSAPVTLKADSITVNEILRPNGFFPSKNAVAVKTPDEDIFYIYKLPGFEFMYTWAKGVAAQESSLRMWWKRQTRTGR